jgi:hypothetical protein
LSSRNAFDFPPQRFGGSREELPVEILYLSRARRAFGQSSFRGRQAAVQDDDERIFTQDHAYRLRHVPRAFVLEGADQLGNLLPGGAGVPVVAIVIVAIESGCVCVHRVLLWRRERAARHRQKKSRRGGTLEGFHHVGLLLNALTSRGRFALYIVVRKRRVRILPLQFIATRLLLSYACEARRQGARS